MASWFIIGDVLMYVMLFCRGTNPWMSVRPCLNTREAAGLTLLQSKLTPRDEESSRVSEMLPEVFPIFFTLSMDNLCVGLHEDIPMHNPTIMPKEPCLHQPEYVTTSYLTCMCS